MAQRPNMVKTVDQAGNDELIPANYSAIDDYLNSRGKSRRLRVYAMSGTAVTDYLRVASQKCRKLGVELLWDTPARWYRPLPAQRVEQIVAPDAGEIFTAEQPLNFIDVQWQAFVRTTGLRPGAPDDDRTVLALGIFQLDSFGNTIGRDGGEGADCPIPYHAPKDGFVLLQRPAR